MKIVKNLNSILFEQAPSRLKKTKSPSNQTSQNKTKPVKKAKTDVPKADTPKTAPVVTKPGELSAETKKKAAINSFQTMDMTAFFDDNYFVVKMNNLYKKNATVYNKVKAAMIAKGYKFGDRFNNINKVINFYSKYLNLAQINTHAPQGKDAYLYWAVVREIFKNYATPDSSGNITFFSIASMQKPMTVTFLKGSQKTFANGMEYFLTRLKDANGKGTPFTEAEALCFLSVLCALSPAALSELNAYAAADSRFSAVTNPEKIVLDELDGQHIVNFYKIFVEGVRKKGGTWEIDEDWVINAGFAPKDAAADKFLKMVNDAVTGNYLDEALPKIQKFSEPTPSSYSYVM